MQVTIANGQSVSGEVSLGPSCVIGLELPAGFEGDAIQFNFGTVSGALHPVQSMAGTALVLAGLGATAAYVSIDPRTYRLTQGFLSLTALTSGSPQAQTGNCVINVTDDARP